MDKLGMIEGTLSSEFGDLVAYEFFKNLALSALGIFIPIIIYDASGNFFVPALYLVVKSGVSTVSAVPIMRFLASKGFEKGLYLSYLFILPSILLLRFLDYSLSMVLAVAVMYSIGKTLHGEAKRLEFTEDTTEEERDKRSADITSIPNMGRFLGPLIAGSLSVSFGFGAMLTFAFSMVALSLIPLTRLDKSIEKKSVSFSGIFRREYWKYMPVLAARGAQGIVSVAFYGLFTYEFVSGSFGSGLVRSLDTLGFVLVAYASAWITGRVSRNTIIIAGSTAAAITYGARTLVQTSFQGFLVAFLGGIAFKLYHIPLFSQLADEAESTSKTDFFALSRVCSSLGMAVASLIFLILQPVDVLLAFQTVFVFAAAMTLTLPLIESRL